MRIAIVLTIMQLLLGSAAGSAVAAPQSTRIDIMLAPPLAGSDVIAVLERLGLSAADPAVRALVDELRARVERHVTAADMLANDMAIALAKSEVNDRDASVPAAQVMFRQREELDRAFARAEEQFFDRLGQLTGVSEVALDRLRYERTLRRCAAVYTLQPEAQTELFAVLDRAIKTKVLAAPVLAGPAIAERMREYMSQRKNAELERSDARLRLIETYFDVAQHSNDLTEPRYINAVRSAGLAENAIIELNRGTIADLGQWLPTDAVTALRLVYQDSAYEQLVPRDPMGSIAALERSAAIAVLPPEVAEQLRADARNLATALEPLIVRARDLVAESARELSLTMRRTDAQGDRDRHQGENAESIAKACLNAIDAASSQLDRAAEGSGKIDAPTALAAAQEQLALARAEILAHLLNFPGGRLARERLAAAWPGTRTGAPSSNSLR